MKAAYVDQWMVDVRADYVGSSEEMLVHRSRIACDAAELVTGRYRRTGSVEHLLLAVRYTRIRFGHARLHVVLVAAERAVRGQVEKQHTVRWQLLKAARQEDEQLMDGRLVEQVPGVGGIE